MFSGAAIRLRPGDLIRNLASGFHDWLNTPFGDDQIKRAGKPAGKKKINANTGPGDEQSQLVWPEDRLAAVQQLWGDGFVSAGAADYLAVTLPLLRLSEKNSLLIVGADLGGPGRYTVEETGAWVSGYVNDKELAKVAKERVKMAGLAKRAPVSYSDYENLELRAKSFDAAVLLGGLTGISDKEASFEKIAASLRPEGELWYADFVLPNGEQPNQSVADWAATEQVPPQMLQVPVVQALMQKFSLDVRPPEDITNAHRDRIFKSLSAFLEKTNKKALTKIEGPLFGELEQLGKQIAAIDSGGLKIYQFHAYKIASKEDLLRVTASL
ncbi:MAG: class I SAM-dependent methyltransferase [Rhodospirillales bacterium]|nr:class I SAM-dependent methyltransferase [Rhodospirillales bacterium]